MIMVTTMVYGSSLKLGMWLGSGISKFFKSSVIGLHHG
jgi:hypothetical protein